MPRWLLQETKLNFQMKNEELINLKAKDFISALDKVSWMRDMQIEPFHMMDMIKMRTARYWGLPIFIRDCSCQRIKIWQTPMLIYIIKKESFLISKIIKWIHMVQKAL